MNVDIYNISYKVISIMMEKSECKVDLSKESMKLENFRLGRKYLMFEALAKENNSVIYYGVEK